MSLEDPLAQCRDSTVEDVRLIDGPLPEDAIRRDSASPHPEDIAAPYPASALELEDHFIDDVRSLKVVVIGAGLAGILAGILLPVKVPNIQLTILEKNHDVVSPMQQNPQRRSHPSTEWYMVGEHLPRSSL